MLCVLVDRQRYETVLSCIYNHSGKLIYRQSCCLQVNHSEKEPLPPHKNDVCSN